MELSHRIESNRISEQQYRSLKQLLNFSGINLYNRDRKAFYEEYILGQPRKEKITSSLIMGSLVHSILAGEDFDSKFVMAGIQRPTGQMGDLCEAMFTRALRTIEDGKQVDSFTNIFTDALNEVKYDFSGNEVAFKGKGQDKILPLFEKEGTAYFNYLLANIGKMVVSELMVTKAEKIVQTVLGHPFTRDIMCSRNESFNELPILFDDKQVSYKALVDKIIVDHQLKTIKTYDFKTSWDNENPEYHYLKYGLYLQAAMYNLALQYWKKENGLEDYRLYPLSFIFVDTQGFSAPVILELSNDDLDRAGRGMKVRGIRYRGLFPLMEDIAWSLESGDWTTTRELNVSQGRIQLRLEYGSKM